MLNRHKKINVSGKKIIPFSLWKSINFLLFSGEIRPGQIFLILPITPKTSYFFKDIQIHILFTAFYYGHEVKKKKGRYDMIR